MATKRMDLSKRCLFVLSGVSNALGKTLAIEMCRRFKPGSLAVLIEANEEDLQEVKKEIQYLDNDIQVLALAIDSWQKASGEMFRELLTVATHKYNADYFESAFILHNEGSSATAKLMEPEDSQMWKSYIQENLFAAVALNQQLLQLPQIKAVPKLVVNITSSLLVKPFVFRSLICSCQSARGMYFRAMANEERRNGVSVLSYSPGLMASHKPEIDSNNNILDVNNFDIDEKLLKMPRVQPMESTLKLINILQEMSFISGHDVDYYDTYVL